MTGPGPAKRVSLALLTIMLLAGGPGLPGRALASAASDYKLLCASCHGDKGKGDGAAASALDPRPASFSDPGSLSRLNDAYLKAVIKVGKTGALEKSPGGYTPHAMPGFSNKLSDSQIKSLISYVRAIQKQKPKPAATEMQAFNAKYADAASLFSANCARCHGPYGEGDGPDLAHMPAGATGPLMPVPPDYRDDRMMSRFSDRALTAIVKLGRLGAMEQNRIATMPGMAAGLSDAGRTGLIAYIRSLAPAPKSSQTSGDSGTKPPAPAPGGAKSHGGEKAAPPAPAFGESGEAEPARSSAVSIVRDPADLPPPVGIRPPQTVRVDLETVEVDGWLADGTSYTYWTFNGKVPGPFIRVREGDTVEVHLKNRLNQMIHSIDLHAVTGPGGGAVYTQTPAGQETAFSFKALNPGLFVYHCASPVIANHISSGMFGLILVEPAGGLPPVDREFYVVESEIYTREPYGTKGHLHFDLDSMLAERPQYVVFNGAVGGLTTQHPLKAKVGETVRIFFGVGGPNLMSSFHLIGGIWDRVYEEASLTSPPLTKVQTTLVPPGGATVVEYKLVVPGRFILVDHALSRLEHGMAGFLMVEGPADPAIFKPLTAAQPPPPA